MHGLDGPGPPVPDTGCRRACGPARTGQHRPSAPIGRPRAPPPLPDDGHHRRSQAYSRRTDALPKIGRSAVRPRPWPPKWAVDQRKQNLSPLVEGPSSICRPPTAGRHPWPAGHDDNATSSRSRPSGAHERPACAHGARPEPGPDQPRHGRLRGPHRTDVPTTIGRSPTWRGAALDGAYPTRAPEIIAPVPPARV